MNLTIVNNNKSNKKKNVCNFDILTINNSEY